MRDVEDELAGVFGGAHHPDRGGRLGERVVRCSAACGSAPSAVSWYTVFSSSPDRGRVADRHQRQVDGVEREVAAEREQPQPGVAVDVALADLDEPPAEGQQFEPGALRGAGQRS